MGDSCPPQSACSLACALSGRRPVAQRDVGKRTMHEVLHIGFRRTDEAAIAFLPPGGYDMQGDHDVNGDGVPGNDSGTVSINY